MTNKTEIAVKILVTVAKILIVSAPLFGVGYYFVAVFTATDWFALVKSFMQFAMMVWLCRLLAAVMK